MSDLRKLSNEGILSGLRFAHTDHVEAFTAELRRRLGERDRLLAAAEEIVEEIEDCVYVMATRQLSEGECIDAIVAVKTKFRALVSELKEGA